MKKRKIRILLVEDVDLFFMLERIRLLRSEIELMTARSGKDILQIVREADPDLLFLDRYLPDMSGVDCCRIVKGDKRYRGMPVIIVSPGMDQIDLECCRAAGCDAIIVRPINRHDFLETICKYLPVDTCDPPRYLARMLVHYGENSQQFLSGYSVDLSADGLFLETDHPLAAKTLLTVEFIFPDRDRSLNCTARVVWTNNPDHPQKSNFPPGMGLQILDLSMAERELLTDYIRKGNFVPIPAAPHTEAPGGHGGGASITKILIVDDNIGNRKRFQSILEPQGYAILEAGTCDEALTIALEEHADLVIANETHERSFGAMLSQNHQTRHLPILVLSGSALSTSSVRGLELGAIADISQLDVQTVLARVNNCLNLSEMSDSFFKMREQLLAKEREAEESLRVASVMQRSLLPVDSPKGTPFKFSWRFLPCDRVGGDLFNVFRLDETHLGVYVMDVSGHGVPAAMVTTSVAQALDPFSGQLLKQITIRPPYYELIPPAMVLTRLNREYPIDDLEKHLTICYMILDMQTGTVSYSSAGHPFPVLVRADGRTERLTKGGTIIGIGEGVDYEEGEAVMEPGDRLFLFTDGIIEYLNRQGDCYGEERFVETLQAAGGESLQMACAHGIKTLISFGSGLYPEDDITLLGVEFLGHGIDS